MKTRDVSMILDGAKITALVELVKAAEGVVKRAGKEEIDSLKDALKTYKKKMVWSQTMKELEKGGAGK